MQRNGCITLLSRDKIRPQVKLIYQNLVKERLLFVLFSFYSIGRIIDSMNWISSSFSPYFL